MKLKNNKATVPHHIFVTMLLLIKFVILKIMVLTLDQKKFLVSGNRPDENFYHSLTRIAECVSKYTFQETTKKQTHTKNSHEN